MRSQCPSAPSCRSEECMDLTPCQPRWDLMHQELMDLYEYLYPTDSFFLPGEDVWKKFELPDLTTPPGTPDHNCDTGCSSSSSDDDDAMSCQFDPLGDDWTPAAFLWNQGKDVRHDCMWAGLCCSDEHNHSVKNDDHPYHLHHHHHHHHNNTTTNTTGNPSNSQQRLPSDYSQDSVDAFHAPSDSCMDESQCAEMCVVSAGKGDNSEYLSSSSSEDTSDDSGEDDDALSTPFSSQSPTHHPAYHSTLSDHSYFLPSMLPKRPVVNTDNLGVQTPSDSEEEIDVVNVASSTPILTPGTSLLIPTARTTFPEVDTTTPTPSPPPHNNAKQQQQTTPPTTISRASLPANPSALVRRQLQVTMAVAAARKTPQHGQSVLMMPGRATAMLPGRATGLLPGRTTALLRVQERPATGRPRRAVMSTVTVQQSAPNRAKGRPSRSKVTSGKKGRKIVVPAFDDDDDDDDVGNVGGGGTGKRSMHNNMERQRRVAQRKMLANLRDQIPEMMGDERVPKVKILDRAAHYCEELNANAAALAKERTRQLRYNERLLKRLQQLRHPLTF